MMKPNLTTEESLLSVFEWERRDMRVESWPLMASVYPSLLICGLYVIISLFIGPAFMKNRQPFNIKAAIMAYNIVQVVGSIWIFQGVLRSGWIQDYNWVCDNVDRNPSPDSRGYQMATWIWVAFLFRFVDFTDTFFFILRKKFEHVSTLQVIHHSVTPLYLWLMVRFVPGGNDSFGALVNYFIHTLMYSYYFLSAMGPAVQKYLWWKRYLTRAQMIQFVICFFKAGVNVVGITDCGYPWQFSLVTLLIMVLMLGLFAEFYVKTYSSKKAAHSNGKTE